jgi:hypothetical protein
MLPISLPTSPSPQASLRFDPAQQRGSFSAPAGGTRMRWVQTENRAPAPGNLHKKPPQPATPDSSSPVDKLPISTPLPTRTLAAFEKLQQQLDRCDKRDLADYASVLRVSDRAAVLGTAALMKLPGQIRDAKASVGAAIDALKACDQMPTRDQQLIYARTHNKAAAVLQGLKRSNPLPPPRLHEADAAGNLIRGNASRSRSAHPLTWLSSQRPHERSYIESLRTSVPAPCPVHFPEKTIAKLNSGATRQQRDTHWQGKQIEREKKLWSGATLEKGNMADALGATEKALTDYVVRHHAMLTPERLNAVTSALERLAPLKKKCKELDPDNTSAAARTCRAQASQENIRASNLLGSFARRTPEKARLEKQLVKRQISKSINRLMPTVPETTVLTAVSINASKAVATPIKPRVRWGVPVNPFTPHRSPDKGYGSIEKINTQTDAMFLDAPFLLDETLPTWARKGLLNLIQN